MSINVEEAERLYKKSEDVLKKSQLRNGGCLATLRGERYPYVYPRDHAFCVLGFISVGMFKEAKKGLEFVLKGQLESGAFPQRYDTKGNDASYKPIQIDGTGLIVYSFCEYIKKKKDLEFAKKYWKQIEKAATYIKHCIVEGKDLIFTPNSIHEFPPSEQGMEIWANCTCCTALRELSSIAKLLNVENDYSEVQKKIKKKILKHMWNSRVKSFVKNIRIMESSSVKVEVDVSQCAAGYFDILSEKHEKVMKTTVRIERELWNKKLGGICRYPKNEGRNNGGWGPWPHFTLMICRHWIKLGNMEKADKYLEWVLKVAYNYELPEHISSVREFNSFVKDFKEAGILRKDRKLLIRNARKHPMFKKGIAYITIPLTWPHAEFIRTWNFYKEVFLKKKE